MEYDRTNTGILFKNDSENEKAPKYTGKINVDGKEYQLAAWIREGKKGKFMSLKVEERQKPKASPTGTGRDLIDPVDDEIPW